MISTAPTPWGHIEELEGDMKRRGQDSNILIHGQ